MKSGCILFLLLFFVFIVSIMVYVQFFLLIMIVFYLLVGLLIFDFFISQFCENFNCQNFDLLFNEFCVIENSCDKVNLICVVSKINENLYVFMVLECGMFKVKSMQIIWLFIQGLEQKVVKVKVLEYMVVIICIVVLLLIKE